MSARKEKDALEFVQKENTVMLTVVFQSWVIMRMETFFKVSGWGSACCEEQGVPPAQGQVRSIDNCFCLLWNVMLRAQILTRWEMLMGPFAN